MSDKTEDIIVSASMELTKPQIQKVEINYAVVALDRDEYGRRWVKETERTHLWCEALKAATLAFFSATRFANKALRAKKSASGQNRDR